MTHCPLCGAPGTSSPIVHNGVWSVYHTADCGWSLGVASWSEHYPSRPCGTPAGPEREASLAAAEAAVEAKREADRRAYEATPKYRFWRMEEDARQEMRDLLRPGYGREFMAAERRYEAIRDFYHRNGGTYQSAGEAYFADPHTTGDSAFSRNPRGTGPFWSAARCIAHHLGLT